MAPVGRYGVIETPLNMLMLNHIYTYILYMRVCVCILLIVDTATIIL